MDGPNETTRVITEVEEGGRKVVSVRDVKTEEQRNVCGQPPEAEDGKETSPVEPAEGMQSSDTHF